MPSLPDKLPNPTGGAPFFWGGAAWDWFVKSLQTIYLAVRAQQTPASQEDVLKALLTINHTLEKLVTQSDNLSAATDRIEAAQTASDAASAEDMRQLRAAIDALAAVPNTDAVAARLSAVADRIEARTAEQVANDAPAAPTP